MTTRTIFMRTIPALAVLTLASMAATPAKANLTIDAIYGSSITSLSDASTVEGVINSTLQGYENLFTNNATITVDFENMGTGLGQSATSYISDSYSEYYSALVADKAGQANTGYLNFIAPTALGTNPVNGQGIDLTTADAKILGIIPASTAIDSTISLNLSIINDTRTNINPNNYDLQDVVSHEFDEVLGVGSALNSGSTTGNIDSSDLYRYSAPGVRSYSTSQNALSFFSLDGGTTDLEQFNQTGGGADYNDWSSNNAFGQHVQDAFGSPGTYVDLQNAEISELQAFGYNTATAPEATSLVSFGALIAMCGIGLVIKKKRSTSVDA